MNQLTNPLQNLVRAAAQRLPVETGKVASQQARLNRRLGAVVLLADVSQSMSSAASGDMRKIDVLREAVAVARANRPGAMLVAFSAAAREVDSIPEPESSTDLANALEAVRQHDPGVTLLISDGQPDDPAAALRVARTWRGVIDVLYVGPECDTKAIDFMRALAAATAGSVHVNDVQRTGGDVRQLGRAIYRMLSHDPT